MTDNATPSNRAAKRDSLFFMAELRDERDGRLLGSARIRNLSATGLMAECDVKLAEGDRLRLSLRGVGEVIATLGWSRDGRIGLIFDEPIDPKAARRPVASGGSAVAEPYRAIGEAPLVPRFPRGGR